ncbi:hypothetical protein HY214_04180 [Candidatus Roizmanbacteria bacterium]|nr:hypothetical protein [Candidatus Roizmanbacteria bacterium]
MPKFEAIRAIIHPSQFSMPEGLNIPSWQLRQIGIACLAYALPTDKIIELLTDLLIKSNSLLLTRFAFQLTQFGYFTSVARRQPNHTPLELINGIRSDARQENLFAKAIIGGITVANP